MIGEATRQFLAEPLPIVVGTRRSGGEVAMHPVWFEFREGLFWLNSRRGTHWLAQVERDRTASLLLVDPADMYRVVHAETRLLATSTEGAGEHLDRLSYRYRGEPYRAFGPAQRVIVTLEPETVRSSLEPVPGARGRRGRDELNRSGR